MKRTVLCTGLMFGIAGFTVTTTPAALAQTYDKNWVGGVDNSWFTNDNWDEGVRPAAGDTVRIDGSFGVPLNIDIAGDDAECESINMDNANILLKGGTLTLGLSGSATTTIIEGGQIQFFDSSDDEHHPGSKLIIRNWVSFNSQNQNGRLYAHATDNTYVRPYIERIDYESDGGIKTFNDFDVEGHFTLYVSVYHDGDYFGVTSEKDTMIFGNDADPFDPDLEISGASLNNETFTAHRGKIIFYQMEFDNTAPKWLASGISLGGSLTGTIVLQSGQITNVPNDIHLQQFSLLEIHDDQAFNGKLYMETNETKVRVKDGAAATFVAP